MFSSFSREAREREREREKTKREKEGQREREKEIGGERTEDENGGDRGVVCVWWGGGEASERERGRETLTHTDTHTHTHTQRRRSREWSKVMKHGSTRNKTFSFGMITFANTKDKTAP